MMMRPAGALPMAMSKKTFCSPRGGQGYGERQRASEQSSKELSITTAEGKPPREEPRAVSPCDGSCGGEGTEPGVS